jgi:hypothetical protein
MPPCLIEWLDEARADVRRVDRPAAMRIFDGILHYARTGTTPAPALRPHRHYARTGGGDVAPLHGDMAGVAP